MPKDDSPWILGISASHNGGACLLKGDDIVVAIQEERLSRIKRDRVYAAETTACLAYCLDYAGIQPEDLTLVVLSVTGSASDERNDILRNPLLKLELNGVATCGIPHHLAHAISALLLQASKNPRFSLLMVEDRRSHFPREGRVDRLINLAHASLANERANLISAETCAGLNGHSYWICILRLDWRRLQIGGILDNFGPTSQRVITTLT